jgi:hypothetical protein
MTDPQQHEDDSYPAHWTPWLQRNDPNPISNMVSGMGFDVDSKHPIADAYPATWRI